MSQILLLGDPRLWRLATEVNWNRNMDWEEQGRILIDTLLACRREMGFGRAIAAPQIGLDCRMIVLCLEDKPQIIINPEIIWRSREKLSYWDDCLSFPWLLVRVRRHRSISVSFQNLDRTQQEWIKIDWPVAELLQHEIDHLDGILAIDRALDKESIISREAFIAQPDYFNTQVDIPIP